MQGPHAGDSRYRWLIANIIPYEGRIRRWLRRTAPTLSASDIDDVIQESYARIWEKTDIACIENTPYYFQAIVRNLVAQQAHRARIVPMERLEEIEALRIPAGIDAEVSASARQQIERLQDILEKMPRQCRRVMTLKLWGYSQRETANELGIAESTVEKHIVKGLALVVAAMSDGALTDRQSTDESRRHQPSAKRFKDD